MAGMQARTWLERFGARRPSAAARTPILASRDLPPLDPLTQLPLPRSPEPLPDEALLFAREAALRVKDATTDAADTGMSIADGADLRAMLERIERAGKRREALDQAAQARARIVERLSAGKAAMADAPPLRLVETQKVAHDEPDLEKAMEEALVSALGTLRQISELPRR